MGLAGTPATASAGVAGVMPFPGTPDASPTTQIIFTSVAPAGIRDLRVVGARSGAHPGHLSKLPAGAGTAFVPDAPFTPGERVGVSAVVGPEEVRLHDSFTIGRPASVGLAGEEPLTPEVRGGGPTLSFRSTPSLHPPAFTVTRDHDRASGDIFLTPTGPTRQQGAMILNARGQLVWFDPVIGGGRAAINLQVQRYHNQPVLTWFRGTAESGEDVIMNRSYRTVAIVRAGDGYSADEHEFSLTPRGTAWLDAYVPVHADLQRVGGPVKGSAFDCVIQEVDVRTGKVLWEWHSLGHVALKDSYAPYATSNLLGTYDYFHLNSIQQLSDGNLVISARNTSAVYEVSRRTGRVVWSLGGKHSSFTVEPGANFEFQHDARLHPGNLLTLFDDAGSPWEESQSSAKELRLDLSAHRASLVWRFGHSPSLRSGSQGSAQLLPNQDVFVGWGSEPYFSEYTPAGRQIFDGHFAVGIKSYRALRFPWQARPRTRPRLAVVAERHRGVTVYASWNGATEVAAWRVLSGATPSALRPVSRRRRTGFQTAIAVDSAARYFEVQALGSDGEVLGTSAVAGR
jgi:hypothetical protein